MLNIYRFLQPSQALTITDIHSASCFVSMCPNLGDHSTATARLFGHLYYDHAIGLGEPKLLLLDSVPKMHDNKAEKPALSALAVACSVCGYHYRYSH